ncbi:hypothetical protein F7734_57190 [Scytonema sp. UIC 10036]|nr:hypothetical protein [Scytonema sp. UIC 10036]
MIVRHNSYAQYQAFNALLKTLEEPPKHVVFVSQQRSQRYYKQSFRCQRLTFENQLEAMGSI